MITVRDPELSEVHTAMSLVKLGWFSSVEYKGAHGEHLLHIHPTPDFHKSGPLASQSWLKRLQKR